MSNYSYFHALFGGVLIGLASFLAAVASGKIPGISGMFSRILRPAPGDAGWRVVFFAGLLAGAALAFAGVESARGFRPETSGMALVAAGLLVGFGTRLGGGCTSGHGVCGLGLGSRTALVATVVFMVAAMAMVWMRHHGPLNSILR